MGRLGTHFNKPISFFSNTFVDLYITHDTLFRHLLAYLCNMKKWSLNESVNEFERIILVNKLKMNESLERIKVSIITYLP